MLKVAFKTDEATNDINPAAVIPVPKRVLMEYVPCVGDDVVFELDGHFYGVVQRLWFIDKDDTLPLILLQVKVKKVPGGAGNRWPEN
jgi:hypothetical protein